MLYLSTTNLGLQIIKIIFNSMKNLFEMKKLVYCLFLISNQKSLAKNDEFNNLLQKMII